MKNEIFGGLIEFESQEKLMNFIETMDVPMAIKIVEMSVEYGLKNGLYTLNEAHCLYNCILKLKSGKGQS